MILTLKDLDHRQVNPKSRLQNKHFPILDLDPDPMTLALEHDLDIV